MPIDNPLNSDQAAPAQGVPADGTMDQGGLEPLGRPGLHHWRQSVITDSTLNERGNVFFAALEMTRMPMILADPRQDDVPIVFANNAFLDLTGYEEGEILGRNCRFLQGALTDQATVNALRVAIARREAIATEILNYRRDGSPFWNAIFMGPVFDDRGELIYFFASQLDVSKRREAEDQFRQAQKMEAIGQLTAGMAHDFNNLIHIITGSLERIGAKRHDPQALDRYIGAATAAAERGVKLTQQMLAFAKRSRLEPRPIDVTQTVNAVAELLETSVGQKAQLHLNLQRRLPSIKADPIQLEMALLNVVVNARDASTQGGAITVTTREMQVADESRQPHGACVLLSVSDEGVGMPAQVRARAVEPFFTTKSQGAGTGLGLAMVHGFAQQSGGRLEIDSAPGQGTTVRMIFPVLKPEAESEAAGQATGYPTRPLSAAAAPPRILVVEDNSDIADLARDTLAEVGYRVDVAHSAEDAIAVFDQARASGNSDEAYRLVFSDVIMPGGANGLVLAGWIREREPGTPIVMTTGYNDEMALEGPQAVAMDVLGKPYRRSELIDRVQAALRRGARSGPGRDTSDFGVAEA